MAATGPYMIRQRSGTWSTAALGRLRRREDTIDSVHESGYMSESRVHALRRRLRPLLPPTATRRERTPLHLRPATPTVNVQRQTSLDCSSVTSAVITELPSRSETRQSIHSVSSEGPETEDFQSYHGAFPEAGVEESLDPRLDSLLDPCAAQTFLRLFKAYQ
ncbi:hypothetical protein CALVIDRAFT_220805 [Calocera viscosa TUFC12733]|uniref:Uncharacterized protein n=1 Tax=Calocera viscosa (strain TUFC12733) TaxID=1330018 RepID=A0A167RKK8_CALVF|nr:hypothetical protein CALVIDRAFT_220805 [Calocera viscosa TUFC12733]